MLIQAWLQLPEEVRLFIADQADTFTIEIGKKFNLDGNQLNFLADLEDEIFLKNMDVLQLPNRLDTMPGANRIDMRLLILDIAYKVLWPLQDYLGGVDRLILRLGGKVPRIQPLKAEMRDVSGLFPGMGQGTAKKMIAQFKDFKELRLTSNKILNEKDLSVSPTVDNWLKDYIHFAGAGSRDSLKRAKYLSKGRNVVPLNAAEKDSLRCLLVSYDQDSMADFAVKEGVLRVSKMSQSKTKVSQSPNFDRILADLHQKVLDIDKAVLDNDFIMSEADNDINKVRNVLWDALGLQDKDKVISCLRLLIVRQMLDLAIKEDNRFRGILKRFINIKYGKEFESVLEGTYDKLIIRRLFLEMLLFDKLRLSDDEALVAAFYLTNLKTDSGQIVYFDKASRHLKWRELDTMGNQLVWQHQIG